MKITIKLNSGVFMEDSNIKIDVIKRSGKKVDFNGEKIAIAIKKGFDGTPNNKYTMVDSNKVYLKVLDKIKDKYSDKASIKIEDIQDLIEEALQELKYKDVYEAFSKYRERRAESRRIFYSKQHKLMKAVESLSFKEANDKSNTSATGTMYEYGSIIATEFAKSYLVKSKFVEAHDSGQINIDDMEYIPMGSTTSCNINLDKLFEKGFSSMYGFVRTPNDIMTYSILTTLAINACSNDQHGGETISAFDYYLAPGVLKTFKKAFKNTLDSYLDVLGLTKLVNYKTLMRQISNLKTIDVKLETFKSFYKNSSTVEMLLRKAYHVAYQETENRTYQAMEALIHNLNTMPSGGNANVPYSTLNFGTDTSPEGRMITKNYLLALDAGVGHGMTPKYPISVFKVKEGINFNAHDPNYDLLKISLSSFC
jgi:anaerobic ribonucleoside-triphosphate reductase